MRHKAYAEFLRLFLVPADLRGVLFRVQKISGKPFPAGEFFENIAASHVETVAEKPADAASFIVKTTQYFVPMAGKIDAEAERKKLADDLAYYEGFLASVMKKLSNERFVASAPEKVVANERAKQADAEAKITAIREQLAALESGK